MESTAVTNGCGSEARTPAPNKSKDKKTRRYIDFLLHLRRFRGTSTRMRHLALFPQRLAPPSAARTLRCGRGSVPLLTRGATLLLVRAWDAFRQPRACARGRL